MTRIGFIGGGKMAEALIKGLLSSFKPEEISVYDIDKERIRYIDANYHVVTYATVPGCNDNQGIVDFSDIVVLAIKPQLVPGIIKELRVPANKLLISIAAGITLGSLEKAFPGVPIVRVMPNNPALVGAGIAAIALGKSAKKEHGELANKIFKSVGEVIMVEEKNMDAVTGLSGSGPAYVYLMIEALASAGEELGIAKKEAEKLAVQTVLGAAKTMQETGKSAKELREMVTSPGGTTVEGLKVLEKRKFSEAIVSAVKAAAEKSKKLK